MSSEQTTTVIVALDAPVTAPAPSPRFNLAPLPPGLQLTTRTRVSPDGLNRERQCIGPKVSALQLCYGAGMETDGWQPEASSHYNRRGKGADAIFQPRCKVCDLARDQSAPAPAQAQGRTIQARVRACRPAPSQNSTQDAPAPRTVRDIRISQAELLASTDEELAVLAQQAAPALRNDIFAIMMQRTEKMRQKAARRPGYSQGYDRADTLTNGLTGLLRAVDTYDPTRPGAASFRTHAFQWIRKHSSNRSLNDQPLRDQIGRRQVIDAAGKAQDIPTKRLKVVSVDARKASLNGVQEAQYESFGFSRDKDQTNNLDLQESLQTLSDSLRALITRRFIDETPISEIAQERGISQAAVKILLSDGLTRLRAMMTGYNAGSCGA